MGHSILSTFSLRTNIGHLFSRPSSSFQAVDGLRAFFQHWLLGSTGCISGDDGDQHIVGLDNSTFRGTSFHEYSAAT